MHTPTPPAWLTSLDKREQSQVFHALNYATNYSEAGAPGHSFFMLIAKLARMLDQKERAR
jgi:hypothetical protein